MSESANSMLSPSITKVSVNIGVGEGGRRLQLAERVLEVLTGMKPTRTISAKTNRDLGTRKGAPIGCKVTLREPETVHAFLKNAFWVREHTLPSYNFDSQGNLSFGISDYTDFPDQKYDPDIGIFGMDVNVVLERPGHRVSRRRRRKSRVSISHRIGREESKEWFVEHYELNIVEE
ncbi:MAG: 50S ribosomal protein L5 [Candidatus Thermoplasmatota archaeon]|mgnify:CR=1 FL=1|jgi:large subunit ribosomal protein L5|nr:50S ribosomal protein L5 [Candidatus Thermoplasmatota archaeon]